MKVVIAVLLILLLAGCSGNSPTGFAILPFGTDADPTVADIATERPLAPEQEIPDSIEDHLPLVIERGPSPAAEDVAVEEPAPDIATI